MKVLRFFSLVSIVLLLSFGDVQARNVGSSTASSRQLKTFFPSNDSDNLMRGFAVFEKGLMLEDSTTTCSFDAFFPVSGSLVLNGGTLELLRDLELKSPFCLGPGTIDGNDSFSIEFPGNASGTSLPTAGHTKLLSLFYNEDLGKDIYSIDWSYDDSYLAIAIDSDGPYYELAIYYVDDLDLTLTASVDLPGDGRAVRWHPSDYYLAVGGTSGDNLEMYYLNIASGTFEKTDGIDMSKVNAVAWDPSGSHLAVGCVNYDEVLVYDVDAGLYGTSYSVSYSSTPGVNRTVKKNALDWNYSGTYLAVGLDSSSGDSELKVFSLTGTVLIEHAEVEIGSDVNGVEWHPTDSLLAVGKSNDSERLLLYVHDDQESTLEVISSAQQAGANKTVYCLDWTDDGEFIAAGMNSSSLSFDVGTFAYDSDKQTLEPVAGYRLPMNVKAVTWSHDGTRLATGNVELIP